MSIAEMLPQVRTLSKIDKISLMQFLTQELEQEEGGLIEPGQSYPVWSPDRAFAAASTMLQVLHEETAQP